MTLNEKIDELISNGCTVEINGTSYIPEDVVEQQMKIIARWTYETVKPELDWLDALIYASDCSPTSRDDAKTILEEIKYTATQAGITEE